MPPSSQAIGYSITKAGRGRRPADRPGAAADVHMSGAASARAGIVVTGNEVLSGRVQRPQRPVAGRAADELGVDLAYMTIVGDRPAGHAAALEFMAEQGMDAVSRAAGWADRR